MAVREPQTHEPGAGGFLAGEVRAYHIGVQKGDKSLLLEGDLSPQPTPPVPAGIPSSLVRPGRRLWTPTRPVPFPAPHLSAAPRGRPSSTCGSEVGAQPRRALGPRLRLWCPRGCGCGSGSGPRGPSHAALGRASRLFLREKLSESFSQSRQELPGCRAAATAAKSDRRSCTKSCGFSRTCGVAAVALIQAKSPALDSDPGSA